MSIPTVSRNCRSSISLAKTLSLPKSFLSEEKTNVDSIMLSNRADIWGGKQGYTYISSANFLLPRVASESIAYF